jgi:hypothetical protein
MRALAVAHLYANHHDKPPSSRVDITQYETWHWTRPKLSDMPNVLMQEACNLADDVPHYHSRRIPRLCFVLANHVARTVAAPASVVFTRADVT